MNFPNFIKDPCISTAPPPPDVRCSDPAFALAHPDICSTSPVLIIAPGTVLGCSLGSVQFQAYLSQNGKQTLLISGVVWSSSDNNTAVIGAISGNATGITAGSATITAVYGDLQATATLEVMGTGCCTERSVATVLIVDISKSMGLVFGTGYPTRLDYAKSAAARYASETNTDKDTIGLVTFDSTADLDIPLTSDKASVQTAIGTLSPGVNLTGIGLALQAAKDALDASSADQKVMVLFSDGEDKDTVVSDDPLPIASAFKNSGGVIIVVGVRAHDSGFNLLNALATGGFFLNAYPATAQTAKDNLSGLKGYTCAGNCVPEGDAFVSKPALDYQSFTHWDVTAGKVDLFGPDLFDLLPGNGLYVNLGHNLANNAGQITSKTAYTFLAGRQYRLSFYLAGNQVADLTGYSVKAEIGNGLILNQVISMTDFEQPFTKYSFVFTVQADTTGKVRFTQQIPSGADPVYGTLLDRVLLEDVTGSETLLDDEFDGENLTYVPPACGPSDLFTGEGVFPMPANYDGAGLATVTGLVIGKRYIYTPGSDDVQIDGGLVVLVGSDGVQAFIPTSDSAQLAGPAGQPITDTLTYTVPGYYGYNCEGEGCLSSPPGVQIQDPSPQADIEAGYVPPTSYSSTKTVTATCPVGSVQVAGTTAVPVMTSPTAPAGEVTTSAELTGFEAWRAFAASGRGWKNSALTGWIMYKFAAAKTILGYALTTYDVQSDQFFYVFTIEGSNDGTNFTTLATSGVEQSTGATAHRQFDTAATFLYYRLSYTLDSGVFQAVKLELFEPATTQGVTGTATKTSLISQADADAKALAAATVAANAALAAVGCVTRYTSNQFFTAKCDVGTFGNPVTKSASAVSYTSQADADTQALAAAQTLAEAALVCTLSNNTEEVVIHDSPDNTPKAASPFPSVHYVSGKTGLVTNVTVTLKGYSHDFPSDSQIFLRSPSGRKVMLMQGVGNGHPVSGLNLLFSDAAGSSLSAAAITSGTWKPSQMGGAAVFPAPAPAGPYSSTLSAFIGDNPNGSWSLWVVDCKFLDSGSLANGWTINITSA